MKEAEKEKKRADSQSVAESPTCSSSATSAFASVSGKEAPTAPDASNARPTATRTVKAVGEMALGSLFTHDPGAAREGSLEAGELKAERRLVVIDIWHA